MRESTWRPKLVRRIVSGSPESVLDLGCGTGTLAIKLARAGLRTGSASTAIPRCCAAPPRKARAAGVELDLRKGLAHAIPLVDAVRRPRGLLARPAPPARPTASWRPSPSAAACCGPSGRDAGRRLGPSDGRAHRARLSSACCVLDGFETTRDHAAGRDAQADRRGRILSRRLREPRPHRPGARSSCSKPRVRARAARDRAAAPASRRRAASRPAARA